MERGLVEPWLAAAEIDETQPLMYLLVDEAGARALAAGQPPAYLLTQAVEALRWCDGDIDGALDAMRANADASTKRDRDLLARYEDAGRTLHSVAIERAELVTCAMVFDGLVRFFARHKGLG